MGAGGGEMGGGSSDLSAGHDDMHVGGDGMIAGSDLGVVCGLVTCQSVNATCGVVGDGCGGVINCGTCSAPQTCGGGGTHFQCGGTAACIPKTCAQLGYGCGMAGDGCGGLIDCGTCMAPQTCGGGGMPSICGGGGSGSMDSGVISTCVPATCVSANATCGPVADGCGNLLMCGNCASPQTCGGGGVPSQCGSPPCVSLTCMQVGATCGAIGDGCGNIIQCGNCASPQSCGGGGTPNQCGLPPCVPRTCMQAGANCGAVGDGCGNIIQCGNCPMPQSCGGGGAPNVCGMATCTPRTCMQAGATCGAVGDGCGNIIMCGSCTSPQICGGGGVPNSCGSTLPNPDGGVFVQCDGGATTTITGTVVAGTDPARGFGQPDPIYNAYVYIPSGSIQSITTGATCDQCTMPQAALVSAVTGIDGKFVLNNPPVGASVPLVIQLGKWQRILNINVNACSNNALTTAQTRLPRNRTEGNIPRFAVDTGNVDVLQCVLRKMGIEDAEFANPVLVAGLPTSPARVHLYQGGYMSANGAGGAIIDNTTPSENLLWGSQTTLNAYDAVLFPCEGGQDNEKAADQARVINYTNVGGRVFATHFSYVWLFNDAPFSATAAWQVNQGSFASATGLIDQTFPKGVALAQWLQLIGASATLGKIPVNVVRHDFNSVVLPSQRWMYSQAPDPVMPLHYTFNTPVGATPQNQCGRVVFSDFHVEDAANTQGVLFPGECKAGPLTAQEKLLEFMLFDLTSCVTPDMPTCTPKTCMQQGFNCGMQGDGCGNVINCGACVAPQTCGGGGTPGVCGGGCVPKTCVQQGFNCGMQGDGCGGTINCGTCVSPQTCGGGGTPGVCGGGCVPKTCMQQGFNCGPEGDGCGNVIQCGTCTPPMSCGGGGMPGVCGGSCKPRTCLQQNLNCGPAGDGCGNLIQCGTCPMGQVCGGGGVPGQCAQVSDMAFTCMPLTCAGQNINCGPAGDGCGGLLQCGPCVAPQTCGGGGTPGQCGAPTCTPRTCMQAMANCGIIGDGCGGTLNCGTCVSPQTCGGGGVANQCGNIQ